EVRRLLNPAAFKLGSGKMAEDIAVPRGRVAEAVRRAREITDRYGLKLLLFGHLGDGNLHVDIMFDAADQAQHDRAAKARDEVFDTALDLGGTVSGEHGIGLSKREAATRQIGAAERGLMAEVRRVFDPLGIMNPGKDW
ncbi:MAG: FAD-linked oxidase C-terminal domain-containing protein, partial [Desulfovibrionaceae bacterium]